jgi:hypothetical protein
LTQLPVNISSRVHRGVGSGRIYIISPSLAGSTLLDASKLLGLY